MLALSHRVLAWGEGTNASQKMASEGARQEMPDKRNGVFGNLLLDGVFALLLAISRVV